MTHDVDVIIENLERAIQVIVATKEDRVNLRRFHQRSYCGTLHCTAGHLAEDPFFKARGIQWNDDHDMVMVPDTLRGLCQITWSKGSDPMFGHEAYDRLFADFSAGEWDEEFFNDYHQKSGGEWIPHKTLALARLNRQLAIYKSQRDEHVTVC